MLDNPGKYRGLLATSSERQIFTILAVDHGASLAATIQPDAPNDVSYEQMVQTKHNVLRHLAPYVSGVLIDPVYGLAPAVMGGAVPGSVGTLLAVEDGDYATPQRPAKVLEGWSVAKIKRAGGTAVKCFFYYHPDHLDLARRQEHFVMALVDDCRKYDLPLFAEPLSYGVQGDERRHVVLETTRRISRLGIDVLKVEFPVDVQQERDEQVWAEACQELSEVCRVPWALLSAGVDFDTFARQLTVACRAGASGYLVGRAVWQDAVTLTGTDLVTFLLETAVPRLKKLANIAGEYGRSWTDFYPVQPAAQAQDWYKRYEEF